MSILDRYFDRAGRSGMRRYKLLARDWRRRTLGRRTSIYFWSLYVVVVAALLAWTPSKWRFGEGLVFGMLGMAYLMLPDVVMPEHIARWQRGAWGEQKTAKALKSLRKQGWLIRHDLATGYRETNRDHIAVGPAVYLLDSKLLKDEVWIDSDGLHLRRVDKSQDEYVVPAPPSR
jgi:Nuclease-related domain